MNPAPQAPLFDAHNHLHDAWLVPHRARVLADLAATGVRACVVNGTCESDWPEIAAFCAPNQALRSQPSALSLLPSYGLHPWDAGNRSPDWQLHLLAYLDAPRPLSPPPPHLPSPISHLRARSAPFIGEIGLDRWILDRARPDDPRLAGLRRAPLGEQLEVFRWQLALAAERNLPASIHCLEAFGPLLEALRNSPLPACGFLLHAYSGSLELVKPFAALGAYFSFNGAFLPSTPDHPECHPLNDNRPPEKCHLIDDIPPRTLRRLAVFRAVPADRLLVETDAPAMRLPPEREKYPPLPAPDGALANHPANLTAAYAGLAGCRGLPPDELASQVENNFRTLFGF